MNKNDFIQYMRYPAGIQNIDVGELANILVKYPYFQSAHLVYSAYLSSKDDILFHDQLKLTAAHVNDRSVLYWLIYNQTQEESAKTTTLPVTEISEKEIKEELKDQYSNEISTTQKPQPQESEPQENNLPLENVPLEPETVNTQIEEPIEDTVSSAENQKSSEETVIHPQESAGEDISKANDLSPKKSSVQETTQQPVFTSHNQPETFLLNIISKRIFAGDAGVEKTTSIPTEKPTTVKPEKVPDLIDKFIKQEPRISKPKRDFFNPLDMAENSSVDKEDIVSETLAQIYISQNLFHKAIKIYQKLYLLIPEKSAYFAAQIENLVKKINN